MTSAADDFTGFAETPDHLKFDEAALDGTLEGNDLAVAVVTGSTPGSTAETDQDSSSLTFTAGSDDITSIVFSDTGSISIDAGLEPGTVVTWTLSNGGRTLTGSIGGVDAIVLQLSGSQSASAGGGTVTPTVTVTLTDAFPHEDNPDADQLVISGVTVRASEADGDFADGSVTVTVLDDAPDAKDDDAQSVAEDAVAGIMGTAERADPVELPGCEREVSPRLHSRENLQAVIHPLGPPRQRPQRRQIDRIELQQRLPRLLLLL